MKATSHDTCPAFERISSAFSGGVAGELQPHLDRCPRCAAVWSQLAELKRVGQEELPVQIPSVERAAELERELLLVARFASSAELRWRWPAVGIAALAGAAAAALVIVVLDAPSPPATPVAISVVPSAASPAVGPAAPVAPAPAGRATLRPSAGAKLEHFTRHDSAPGLKDEVVRLSEGTLELAVDPLGPDQRFRVLTADAEIELSGTRLAVVVSGERLQMIRVESGVAELRPRVGPPQLIAAGQTWSAAPPPLPTIAEAPVDREPGALPKAPLAPARSPPPVAEAEPAAPEPEPEPMVPATPDPSGAEEAFARGFGALRQGDFAPAAREFEALIEAYPGSPLAEDARFWRAVALAKSGAEAAAEEALRDFLARYPGTARSAEAALMLGWRRVAAGDTDEAGGWFRRAAAEGSPQLKARAEEALRYLLNPQERGR